MEASAMLMITLSSNIKSLIQTVSFVASLAETYSVFVVESAIVSCFELFQLTAPPLRIDQPRQMEAAAESSREAVLKQLWTKRPRIQAKGKDLPRFSASAERRNTKRDFDLTRIFH
ncbi:hypothetical protein V6N13_076250 [Hibiscus sabdariffa]